MEIQCPNCKSTQMTKGRIEFPCRKCGTILRDSRADIDTELYNRYVNLGDVVRIAKKNGVYHKMGEILYLAYKENTDEH